MATIEPRNGKYRVRWREPNGAARSKQFNRKQDANGFKAKIENELAQSRYLELKPVTWSELRDQYENDVLSLRNPSTQQTYRIALNNFQEVCKPRMATDLTTAALDRFKARRVQQDGKKKKSHVSPATINNELRVIRALVNKAIQWKYLQEMPVFNWCKEPKKMPRFMTEEHFSEIYRACSSAKRPSGLPYPAEDWWQGLLVFIYFTGWRISEPTSLRRKDVDLVNFRAITRHADNKGMRDDFVRLHPVVVDHLENLQSFHAEMFPWPHGDREIYREWHRIQDVAGIHLECEDSSKHECNSQCRHYGFHDIRRAFATVTGAELSPAELQAVMRHKSYATTEHYINTRKRMAGLSTDKMKVPTMFEAKRG